MNYQVPIQTPNGTIVPSGSGYTVGIFGHLNPTQSADKKYYMQVKGAGAKISEFLAISATQDYYRTCTVATLHGIVKRVKPSASLLLSKRIYYLLTKQDKKKNRLIRQSTSNHPMFRY